MAGTEAMLAEELGFAIIDAHDKEMWDDYFEETTKRRYEKWFVKHRGGRRPFLDEMRHGGAITIDEHGKAHYWMLNRKLYHMRKRGRRLYPDRREMHSAVKEYLGKMYAETISSPKVTREGSEVKVTLPYTRLPPEFGGEYSMSFNGHSTDKESFSRGRRISSLDKLIMDAIGKWSVENGVIVDVESRME